MGVMNVFIQPAWTQEANIPLSKEEIEDVLIDLANKFGFQKGAVDGNTNLSCSKHEN